MSKPYAEIKARIDYLERFNTDIADNNPTIDQKIKESQKVIKTNSLRQNLNDTLINSFAFFNFATVTINAINAFVFRQPDTAASAAIIGACALQVGISFRLNYHNRRNYRQSRQAIKNVENALFGED